MSDYLSKDVYQPDVVLLKNSHNRRAYCCRQRIHRWRPSMSTLAVTVIAGAWLSVPSFLRFGNKTDRSVWTQPRTAFTVAWNACVGGDENESVAYRFTEGLYDMLSNAKKERCDIKVWVLAPGTNNLHAKCAFRQQDVES
jgi:hypothetical protein